MNKYSMLFPKTWSDEEIRYAEQFKFLLCVLLEEERAHRLSVTKKALPAKQVRFYKTSLNLSPANTEVLKRVFPYVPAKNNFAGFFFYKHRKYILHTDSGQEGLSLFAGHYFKHLAVPTVLLSPDALEAYVALLKDGLPASKAQEAALLLK